MDTESTVTLTVTESWNGADGVTWTAREGRRVVATVYSAMRPGGVDSDELRQAIADHYGLGDWTEYHQRITYARKRSDAHRVVPRAMRVRLV